MVAFVPILIAAGVLAAKEAAEFAIDKGVKKYKKHIAKKAAKLQREAASSKATKELAKEATVSAAEKSAGLLSKKMTVGGVALAHAGLAGAGLAASVVEYETQFFSNAFTWSMQKLAEVDVINFENLEGVINSAEYVHNALNPLNKSLQNQFAGWELSENSTEVEINSAKAKAMAWQMTKIQALLIPNGLRMALIEKIDELKDDPKKANRYLADEFINDLVENAQVEALGEHQVNENDIKNYLKQHPDKIELLPKAIEEGLKDKWPDLYEAPEVEQDNTLTTTKAGAKTTENNAGTGITLGSLAAMDIAGLSGGSLKQTFDQADKLLENTDLVSMLNPKKSLTNMFNSVMIGIVGFIADIADWFGADNMADSLRRKGLNMAQDIAEGQTVSQGNLGIVGSAAGFFQNIGTKISAGWDKLLGNDTAAPSPQ